MFCLFATVLWKGDGNGGADTDKGGDGSTSDGFSYPTSMNCSVAQETVFGSQNLRSYITGAGEKKHFLIVQDSQR